MLKNMLRKMLYIFKKTHTLQSLLSFLNSQFCEVINHIKLSGKKKHCHLGKSQQSLHSTSKSVSLLLLLLLLLFLQVRPENNIIIIS